MADAPHVAVLAAGLGRRFGGNKLEAVCGGKPLGRWVIDAVTDAGLGPGRIVSGLEGISFAEGWQVLVNPHPERGLGSSLAIAARAALDNEASALLVLLADMPLVTSGFLRQLAAARAPAATRQPDGHAGVPALLDRALLEKVAGSLGDRGAGSWLGNATLLDPPPGLLRDVDTPEDLAGIDETLTR